MPDPYVGWEVFLLNALVWGPIIVVLFTVEKIRDAKSRRDLFRDLDMRPEMPQSEEAQATESDKKRE